MREYQVKPIVEKKDRVVSVPGSKSITNRALLMSALSEDKVLLKGVLFSDDSRYFLQALQDLGFKVDINESEKTVVVIGQNGKIPREEGRVYVGSAGTAARFLTAMLGLSGGKYTIDASEQMKKRPMKPLFETLESLGCRFEYLENPYFLPVRTLGRECNSEKSRVELDISKTSQPLSALLMTAVMLKEGLEIEIVSEKKQGSYIEITRTMMREFGCDSQFDGRTYSVRAESNYSIDEYQIEPDVSAACYFYGIAAITGTRVLVRHVHESTMQGDIAFVYALEKMGCTYGDTEDGIWVQAPENDQLKGLNIDMNNFSDQALTMAAVAVFADTPVTINNIGHIRVQECDRLRAIGENLKRLGVFCEEGEDWIKIYPGKVKPAEIETFEDHRVAMAFTMIGLREEGVTILNPMCCRKTFENYYDVIETFYK